MGEGGCLCQWEPSASTDRSRSDCVHEQVAKRIVNVRFTIQAWIIELEAKERTDLLRWRTDIVLSFFDAKFSFARFVG